MRGFFHGAMLLPPRPTSDAPTAGIIEVLPHPARDSSQAFHRMSFLSTHPELAFPSASEGDPFIALEALDDAQVDAWVGAQNQRTMDAFGHTPDADALTARLAKAYTSKDRIVTCSRYGDWGYNTWQ